MNKKYILISIISITISVVLGILSNDLIIGGTTLTTSLLCSYFASEGKRSNYIYGILNALLISYVSLKNNLFGVFFFYIFVCTPMQIYSFIAWNKNMDKDDSVIVREFTLKN